MRQKTEGNPVIYGGFSYKPGVRQRGRSYLFTRSDEGEKFVQYLNQYQTSTQLYFLAELVASGMQSPTETLIATSSTPNQAV